MKGLNVLLLISTLALTGCFLEVTSTEGGAVEYSGGTCDPCDIEILDATFDETFTAVPADGYVFSHWRVGNDYQCPGSEDPECVVSNTQFAGNTGAEAHIASDKTYYLEAVYRALRPTVPVLVDADGDVIGFVGSVNLEYIWIQAEGNAAYVGLSPSGTLQGGYPHFAESGCEGDAYAYVQNNGIRRADLVNDGGRYTFYVPSDDEPQVVQILSKRLSATRCDNYVVTWNTAHRLIPVEITVDSPLRVEMR